MVRWFLGRDVEFLAKVLKAFAVNLVCAIKVNKAVCRQVIIFEIRN